MIAEPAKNLQFLWEPLRIKIVVMGVGGENILKFPIAGRNNQEKKRLTSDGIIGGHTNICFLKADFLFQKRSNYSLKVFFRNKAVTFFPSGLVVHGIWEEKSDPVEKAAKRVGSYGAAMPHSEQERKGS